MNHQAKSNVLLEVLKQVAHDARMLTARTVGTTCIVLGSFVARSLVGPLPGGSPAPEDAPPAPPATTEKPVAAAPDDHSLKGAA